jgi:hypothetical protein
MRMRKPQSNPGKKEVSRMHCPCLLHNDDRCEAVQPRFRPSEFDLDESCTTEKHLRCPLYRSHFLTLLNTGGKSVHEMSTANRRNEKGRSQEELSTLL